MPSEPINLLPEARVRTFRRAYFLRLLALTLLMLTLLTGAHALFLAPTHQLIAGQIAEHQPELTRIISVREKADQALFEARLAALTKSAERIQSLGKARSVVETVAQILDIPRANVSLSGLSYTPPSATKKIASMSLTGVAKTRADLRQYQIALQASPLVASAELPVTTYSKGVDLSFTIGVALTAP